MERGRISILSSGDTTLKDGRYREIHGYTTTTKIALRLVFPERNNLEKRTVTDVHVAFLLRDLGTNQVSFFPPTD